MIPNSPRLGVYRALKLMDIFQSNVLQELNISSTDIMPQKTSPKFSEILAESKNQVMNSIGYHWEALKI